ncbi:MAG: hypothetical protein ABIQ31_12310 [Ferruginibacter sp.]
MKNNLQANPLLFKLIILLACFMLTIVYNQSKAAGVPARLHTTNKIAVNFKHNSEKNELTIRIKSGTENTLQLFIFTADGILIKEVAVCAHMVTTVKGLGRGQYIYECFDNDERVKSGSLIIK